MKPYSSQKRNGSSEGPELFSFSTAHICSSGLKYAEAEDLATNPFSVEQDDHPLAESSHPSSLPPWQCRGGGYSGNADLLLPF